MNHLHDVPSVTSLHPAVHAVHYKVLKLLDNRDLDNAMYNNTHQTAIFDLQDRLITTLTMTLYTLSSKHGLCRSLISLLFMQPAFSYPLPHHALPYLTLCHLPAKAVLVVVIIVIVIAVMAFLLLVHYFSHKTGSALLFFFLLRGRGAPHLHGDRRKIALRLSVHRLNLNMLSRDTPAVSLASSCWPVCLGKRYPLAYVSGCIHLCFCVQENLRCLVLTYNPSDCKGQLSSCLPPFTWPRWTTG